MSDNNAQPSFPSTRMRRIRASRWVRDLVQENHLQVSDLIWPVFVTEEGEETAIATMPGVERLTINQLVDEASKAKELGIPAIALFPCVPANKKSDGAEEAFNPDNLVCRAVAALKQNVQGLGVICDVALDPYTSHGQDGLVENGVVLNDETVGALCKQAITLAKAGCDVVAPSDMMDGRIGAIRTALDNAKYEDVMILSYAAKYASAFYGPFRDAVGSKAALGTADKRTYQMNPANSDEALREVALDVAEGADMVMVKPGGAYLDIIQRVSENVSLPVFGYQVSGEYAMLRFASQAGALDYEAAMLESLLAYKRAGANAILTYAAKDAAALLAK